MWLAAFTVLFSSQRHLLGTACGVSLVNVRRRSGAFSVAGVQRFAGLGQPWILENCNSARLRALIMSIHHNSPGQIIAPGGLAADATMEQIEDVVELAVRRHEVFTEAHRQIDKIIVVKRSPDGAVEVTVGSSGNLLNVQCAATVRAMPPHQVAAIVQHCMQAAQAEVAIRVQEILRAAAPGDPLADELATNAARAFPAPPVSGASASNHSGPRQMAIGDIEDDDATRPRRVRLRRPAN
jgi:hypothetical protein